MASKDFSQKLKDLRLKAGFTQKQVYEHFNIPQSTFSSWEVGKSEPSGEMLIKLCDFYNCDMLKEFSSNNNDNVTYAELKLIEKYRALDLFGKETVNIALDRETTRVRQINNAMKKRPAALRIYTYMHHIACAGNGFYFDDIPTDTIEAPYMEDADFIIGVNGDSMEPTYYDGDMVYVQKRQIIEIGEIGIFFYDNECFIKEAGEEGLISHNDNYPIIPGSENIQCIGKVLGKVPDDSEEESTNNINDFEIHSVNQAFKKALAADKARNRTDKIG